MSGFKDTRISPHHSEEDAALLQKRISDEQRRFGDEMNIRGVVMPGQVSPTDGRMTPGTFGGREVVVFFTGRETDTPVHHNLGRKCSRFLVVDINAGAGIYRIRDGDRNKMWLRCTVPGVTAKILCLPDTDGRVRRHG